MKKISVGSWAYTFGPYEEKPISLDTVIKEVGKMGFDGLSLGGFKPHAHPDLYPKPEDKIELQKMLAENNLEVVEYSPDVNIFNQITQQKDYLSLFGRYIDFMCECGFSIVRLDTGVAPVNPVGLQYKEAMKRTVDTFQKASEISKEKGIEVVWEFEPGFLFNKPSEIIEICDRVNKDNFSILFDTCHAYMCSVVGARQIGQKEVLKGGVIEFIEKLNGKIGLIHLIDSDGTLHGDETSTHAPFGLGVHDFDAIMPAIEKKGGYMGDWWVIDLCFWPEAWKATKQCKNFVDDLNKKYA